MTNEEGLKFDETAHQLKSKTRESGLPLTKEVKSQPIFGKFSAEGLAQITINPNQVTENVESAPKEKSMTGLVAGIVVAIATILVFIGIALGYRYHHASIEGEWTSSAFSQQMKESLKSSTDQGDISNSLPQGEELITNIQTNMSIVQNKAQLTVSFTYNRKGLYQTYKSRVNELKQQYGEAFSDVFDANALSEEGYYKQFDETIQKELPKSYRYDSKTGRVTTVAFTGEVNRWEQTITVNQSEDSDSFKKGDVLDYIPKGSDFIIQAHSDYGDISFTKNK